MFDLEPNGVDEESTGAATSPPPAKRGRPSKFTPERTEKVLHALRAGNYRETACRYAGISYTTFRKWLMTAEQPDAPPEYIEFAEAVEKAEADAEIFDLAIIRRASQDQHDDNGDLVSKGSWQAAAWIRERKNPERWGRREATKVEVTGAEGGPVQMQVSHLVDVTAIEGLAAALERRALERGDEVVVVDAEVVEERLL